MNYDRLAAMKVVELRQIATNIHMQYNEMTGSRIVKKEIRKMPKARLLYILCRYWAEIDVEVKYKRMKEELKHREEVVRREYDRVKQMQETIIKHASSVHRPPPMIIPSGTDCRLNPITGRYILTIEKEDYYENNCP